MAKKKRKPKKFSAVDAGESHGAGPDWHASVPDAWYRTAGRRKLASTNRRWGRCWNKNEIYGGGNGVLLSIP